MSTSTAPRVEVPEELIDAIRSLPTERVVEHCGQTFRTSPFVIYGKCPACGKDVKVRAFSAASEIEDVFDAVFEWMSSPAAARVAEQRCQEIEAEKEA
jgi:predicted  nucleic acid-binding Zn-ribbon protein